MARNSSKWIATALALGLIAGACATAATIVSAAITNSEPGAGMGRRRPLASGSPSSIWIHSIAFTLPSSSPMTRTGFVRIMSLMPSCSAW